MKGEIVYLQMKTFHACSKAYSRCFFSVHWACWRRKQTVTECWNKKEFEVIEMNFSGKNMFSKLLSLKFDFPSQTFSLYLLNYCDSLRTLITFLTLFETEKFYLWAKLITILLHPWRVLRKISWNNVEVWLY